MNIKKIFLSIIFIGILLFHSASAFTLKTQFQNSKKIEIKNIDNKIISIINQINESIVLDYLESIVSFGIRYTSNDNCTEAADYIYSEFEKMGLYVTFDNWNYPLFKDRNVVAVLNGTNNPNGEKYIISAHYDTWFNSTGANDDASGVAAVLAIAKVISQYSFNNTVCFIAFSGHDTGGKGSYGSYHYASEAYERDENILGVLNIDAIGSTIKNKNLLQLLKSSREDPVATTTCNIAEKYFDHIGLFVETLIVDMAATDHQCFIDCGFNGLTYIQPNWYSAPCHSPADNMDNINISFVTDVTRLAAATLVDLAKNTVDVQVRLIEPKEKYVYVFDHPISKTFGFNLRRSGIRAMTYVFGGITAKVNISSKEEINYVYYTIDNKMRYMKNVKVDTPYNCKITRTSIFPFLSSGKHTLKVTVTTIDGGLAFDEMDIFFI